MTRALLLALLLGACGAVDVSPGASGFPDAPYGDVGDRRGWMRTDGTIILNREVPPEWRPNIQ